MSNEQPGEPETAPIIDPKTTVGDLSPDALIPLVYDELRRVAGHALRRRPQINTLQPTALVNEAFICISKKTGLSYQDRTHFFAVAAQAMWWVLNDYVDRQSAKKRGGGRWKKITLSEAAKTDDEGEIDLLDLRDALKRLETMDERSANVVKLRYFGGLSIKETAEVMEISETTVKKEWSWAKAWLRDELLRD